MHVCLLPTLNKRNIKVYRYKVVITPKSKDSELLDGQVA